MDSRLNLTTRPRRLRSTSEIRNLVAETSLSLEQLVYPLFFTHENAAEKTDIKTLPGLARYNVNGLLKEIEICLKLGIKHFALFPKINDDLKNSNASEALNAAGLVPQTIRLIKQKFPEAHIFSDIALDPFSSDGHDGLVRNNQIINDETVSILTQMALVHADAGADFVSPSDMMDGRIGAIREALEENGFQKTGIMAYTAKYASSFYGPFRDALDSAPRAGDKKTYQMDYRNIKESLTEAYFDIEEGADIIMVKPGLPYLDVIQYLSQNVNTPIAAYNVSGEYAMIKFAALAGAMDEQKAMIESLYAFRRAGARIIFTYFAKQYAELLAKGL